MSVGGAHGPVALGPSNNGSPPFVYNFTRQRLANTRAKLANLAAATSNFVLACWGDSQTAGMGAGTGGPTYNATNAYQYSYPAALAAALPAAYKARHMAICGDHNTPETGVIGLTDYYNTALLSFSATSGWTRATGSLGGSMLVNTSGNAADTMTYTPPVAVDSFYIYWQRLGTGGTFTVSDSSGTLATINTAGSQTAGYMRTLVTRAAASTNPINIVRSVAGDLYIGIIDPFNSAQKSLRVLNFGATGTTAVSQSAVSLSSSPSNAIKVVSPDLTLIQLGTNDITTGVTVAAYTAALQIMVASALSTGSDVVLIFPHNDTSQTNATRQPYRDAMFYVAITNGLIMVDWTEWVNGQVNPSSLYFDSKHLLAPGYALEAATLLALLT